MSSFGYEPKCEPPLGDDRFRAVSRYYGLAVRPDLQDFKNPSAGARTFLTDELLNPELGGAAAPLPVILWLVRPGLGPRVGLGRL